MTRAPGSTEFKDLEKAVLKVFRKLKVMTYPVNAEDCHWVKISNGFKKVTINFRNENMLKKYNL